MGSGEGGRKELRMRKHWNTSTYNRWGWGTRKKRSGQGGGGNIKITTMVTRGLYVLHQEFVGDVFPLPGST